MLGTMNDAEVSMIAKGRGLTTDKVRELQKQRVLLPAEAVAAGLVNELAPYGSTAPLKLPARTTDALTPRRSMASR